jgi:hypothetical protein
MPERLQAGDFCAEGENVTELRLVRVHRRIADPEPAVFDSVAAAKYLGTNRTDFPELVRNGHIPYIVHKCGKARLYLKSDLDDYLFSLQKHRMAGDENPLTAQRRKNERQE